MSNNEDRSKSPESAARLNRSPAQYRETERLRAFEAVEATFPPPATATPDELVQMAIHALGFDAAGLAASLGISRAEGDSLHHWRRHLRQLTVRLKKPVQGRGASFDDFETSLEILALLRGDVYLTQAASQASRD